MKGLIDLRINWLLKLLPNNFLSVYLSINGLLFQLLLIYCSIVQWCMTISAIFWIFSQSVLCHLIFLATQCYFIKYHHAHMSDPLLCSAEATVIIQYVASQPWLWNNASRGGMAFLLQESTCVPRAKRRQKKNTMYRQRTFQGGNPRLGVSHSPGFTETTGNQITVVREHAYQHN